MYSKTICIDRIKIDSWTSGKIPLPAATIKWHMILHRIDLFIKTIDLLFPFGIYTSENTSNSHLNHR